MRGMAIRRVERADGPRWQVYAKDKRKSVYVGTYESKRLAEEAEEEYRVKRRQIRDGTLPPESDLRRTLREAHEEWLAELLKRGSRSESIYRQFFKDQILPWLGSVPIASIRKPQIVQWRDECATKYAPTSVNAALGCLSSAFNSFAEKGWVAANPCKGVRQLEVKERAYAWIRTVPEMERLLRSCDTDIRDLVAVALGTGMRIDELLHLQWDDVDLDRRLLTVQRGRKGTPKGGMRHVPILDVVLPVLRARSLRRDGAILVWPSRTQRVRSKPHVNTSFRAAIDRAGLDKKIRFHDLRHTFASHWMMNGGDIFRLSKVLGHKSVLVTQRTYAHLAPEAWQQDYQRVSFAVSTDVASIYEFPHDANGRLTGRRIASHAFNGPVCPPVYPPASLPEETAVDVGCAP